MKRYLYTVQILSEMGRDLTCMFPWDSDGPLKPANLDYEIRNNSPEDTHVWECFDESASMACVEDKDDCYVYIEDLKPYNMVYIPWKDLRYAVLVISPIVYEVRE